MSVTAETMKTWISRLLLGFVLVTIGFAAGRRTAPQPTSGDSGEAAMQDTQETKSEQVVVYAAHMTFRCEECRQIEWLARELVENEFAVELEAGRLDFQTVDYMKNTDFAKRFNVSSSTIVVAHLEDGEEQGFKRLDEVWTKVHKPDEFKEYVRAAIHEALDSAKNSMADEE